MLVAQGAVRLSPLQLALVALVYGHTPRGVSRPRAAQLLWGTDVTPETRHRLRQLLVEIRSRVGGRIIETHGDLLRPRPDIANDLEAFEHGLANGPLLDCALIARGGFAQLTLGGVADDYDDWRRAAELAQVGRLRAQALSRWERANVEGDWLTAKDAAEALYALDPEDRGAVRRMIDILAQLGQPESAEQVFAEYRAGLSPEVEPATDIVDSVGRVRRLKEANPSFLGPIENDVPLFGRRDALAAARAIFDEVATGNFAFVLIGGEAGIGKTRILRELHREGVLRDFRCLEARAVELECRIPLNPILDALESVDLGPHLTAIGRPWDSVVGAVLPFGALDEPAAAPPPIQDSALPRRLLDAFSLLFESLASERPTVLFLDDLQWADPTTVATLQFMQRRWSQGCFGIVATMRPDLVSAQDDVAKYMSTRSDGLGIHRIDLCELTNEDALRLVEHIGNGEIGQELAQRICALAGMHPLYLIELARDYLAGRLRLPELPVHEVTIPLSLKQMLDSRLTYLDDEALKLAGMLAVAGKPMRLGAAARLAGLSLDLAADAADELRRARLIEYERDRVRIAHELFRSAIYRHISEPRRAINHRAVAEHLEAEAASDVSAELATHYSRAGDAAKAAKHAWAAAQRAMDSGAVAEAAHFFQLVIENDRDPLVSAEATAGQARALHLTRDINRANPLLELASNRLYAVGRPSDALRLDIKRIEGLAEVGTASLVELLDRLERIKTRARELGDWEGVALALDAELHLRVRDGDVPGAKDVFDEFRNVLGVGGREACALAHTGLAVGLFFGNADEALNSGLIGVQMSKGGPADQRLTALNRYIIVLYHRGEIGHEGSRPYVEEALDLAERSGDRLQRYSLESNLAAQFMDAGDLERADVMLDRARRLFGSADMASPRVNHAFNVGELALAKGDFHRAELAFRAASEPPAPGRPRYTNDFFNAGLGLCALATGAYSSARRHEEVLSEPPSMWYFDPTTIVAFRARMRAVR